MAKDPYKLLGVSKSASDAEIKSAYRKLAKKLHPDVNPGDDTAAQKFKEITAAYTLLSDKDLKARYDSGQVDASGQAKNPFQGGFRQGQFQDVDLGAMGGMSGMQDLFSSLFGMQMGGMRGAQMRGGSPFGQMAGGPFAGGGGGYARQQKGADIRYKLALTFVEALKGGKKRVKMGDGKTLDVKIPKGVDDGQTLRLRGKGQAGVNGGPRGDAKVEITVKSHKAIRRDGDNLRLTLPISLKEAVLGAKVKIPMPDGSLSLSIPAGTNSGKTFRLKGKGVNGGDLLATTQIILNDAKDEELLKWAENCNVSPKSNPRENLLS